MKTQKISKELARKIIINAQLLGGKPALSSGKKCVTDIINKLGYIQVDTISAINRSHHQTLWTRLPNYREEMLHELQSKDRLIYEYWGHAMSYLPMSDYRFSLSRMRNFQNPTHVWIKTQLAKCENLLQLVLERVRKEGPLRAKDFTSPKREGGTWWDWKPAKVALEILFWRGELMISERRKFQKVYDLTERVLPQNINSTFPTGEELGEFFVRRALLALGLANEREIQKFMQPETSRDSDFLAVSKEALLQSLNDLIEAKIVVPVSIDDNKTKTYYALSGTIENSSNLKSSSEQVYLLSPFDNLIIQRNRTKQLFDFDYTLECYMPAEKRKFGYFVLPILWNGNFVGRLDPKADRKNKTLIIKNIVFEPAFSGFEESLPSLVKKLVDFAKFNNCEKIELLKITPGKIIAKLKYEVKKSFE